MLKMINANRKDAHKRSYRKHGFTLIETVLALGLLMILVIIVYQGFMSTIQLSANTLNYEVTGDLAAGMANSKVATAVVAAAPPAYAIHLDSSVFTNNRKNIGVCVYKAILVTDTNYGDTNYREAGSVASTSRTGFWYAGTPLS